MKLALITIFVACLLWQPTPLSAQDPAPTGSIKIIGLTRQTGKRVVLDRKRFFLMRGGRKDHKTLIERLKAAETTSRDCFYSNLGVSPEFMCWLKTADYNCESPYCREITQDDVDAVPEFLKAYQQGLKQFGGRSEIARTWLTTNLPNDLRQGYYRQQKAWLNSILQIADPIQSVMTDTILGTAFFVDIPLNLETAGQKKKKNETFLISNLLPVEIGEKSYVWVCEVKVGTRKPATFNLLASEKSKKRCVVITKTLPACKSGGCKDSK